MNEDEINAMVLELAEHARKLSTAARLSDHDRAHIGDIVAASGPERYTNYCAHVLRLVKKADLEQREVLRLVYPDHVEAIEEWERQPLSR